jgi:hypothetical protein
MMGGAASGSGSGAGSTVFNPVAQPAANAALGNIFQPLADLSANAGAGTPAGINYPMAQSAVYNDIVNSPFANQAIWGSDQAAQNAFNIAAPQAFGGAQALGGAALGGLPFAGQALSQGFDPRYGAAISGIENNPYYGQALGGAQAAAGMGAQGANAIQGLGGQIGGTVDPLLSSGFDPRAALFNRTEGRLMDQTNAINAMSGVAGTPYGASVTANALGNFDIDWQNQQLARQAQATGAAGSAANTAGGLYGAAPGLMASSAGLPSGVYTSNIGQILQALDQRNKAGALGAAGFGSLLGSGGQGLGQANNLNLSGVGAQQQYGAAPYNTQAGIGANALSGLTNLTNLGNNQFALPQQSIGDLLQYMGYGQNASALSGSLGNLGFNQTAQGLGGLLGGANTLFGQNSLLGGSNGIFGAGGLFGSGAGAGATGFLGPAVDAAAFGGVPAVSAGAAGSTLADFLPLLGLGIL